MQNKKASKGNRNPLEATYWQLPETHFHDGLQKVKVTVDGFTELIRETTPDEYSYANGKSRGKLPRGIVSFFSPN
jgi:hypothetical protein